MAHIQTPDATKIYYSDWGEGKPVVLIHGWPLNCDMWEKQATFLAENGVRVITYDRRGFGQSSQTWEGYNYDTFAADLNALMEELDLQGATFVGFSMGGGEVVRYFSRYGSERVAKVVLVAAVTPYLLKTDHNPDGIDPQIFADIETNIRKDRFDFLKSFGAKFYGRTMISHTVSDAVLDWTFSMALTASLHSTLAAAAAWSATDFRREMAEIDVPVLVIHGSGDSIVPLDVSAIRSAALLPNAKLSVYDGEPHGLIITAADRLNTELLAFVNEDSLAEHRVTEKNAQILI
jgi:pimeloyl-ACP methyl ester carboxylesterase